MNEPNPGRHGGGYQPQPGGSRQPGRRPDANWYPPHGEDRGPVPPGVASERGRGRHQSPDGRQWHDPAPTVLDLNLQEHKAGRNWAQIAGTVFFLIDTLVMADGFARPVATGARVLVIFIWLISLAVVALLWLRGSSSFLKSAFLKFRLLKSLAVRNPAP
jgi:hypothetical protein